MTPEEKKEQRNLKRRKRLEREKKITVPLFAFIGMVLAILMLTLLLWSTKRRQNAHLDVAQPGELRELLPSIVGLTHGTLLEGNSLQILRNGAFFNSVLAEIAKAKETINFETYVWWKGDICRQIAEALSKKAREGLEVRLLVDASGSSRSDDELFEMMEQAGVKIGRFHPVRISNLGRLNNRDHRKIVVIDGRIGFTGGHGVAEEWTGNGQDLKHWSDIFVRVEGPIVGTLQSAFTENWIEETSNVPAGAKFFPKLEPKGSIPIHAAYSSPSGTVSSVQLLYYLAINAAKKEILIQNPYFLPDDDAISALEKAVERGVDVRVMIPSTDVTDSAIVQHASHHHFGTLLKRGVKIYEYKKTLLHQKVLVVDGYWSSVGSTNFDDRSFELNDEISLGIHDTGVAEQLRTIFFEDMKFTEERKFDEWSDRALKHKAIDGMAFLVNEQL